MPVKDKRIEKLKSVDIYPVVGAGFTADRDPVEVLRAIGRGGARMVQLREKGISDKALLERARQFRGVCDEYEMLLIIDDRVDIALACKADGVHLGQDDLPLACARLMAPQLIIGRSTHSIAQALEAQDDGADYVNLGPIFPTATKILSIPELGTEIIEKGAAMLNIPFTVMGGIKERHIDELLELGARKIAMVTEITQANDVEGKVRDLRAHWTAFFQKS